MFFRSQIKEFVSGIVIKYAIYLGAFSTIPKYKKKHIHWSNNMLNEWCYSIWIKQYFKFIINYTEKLI